MTKRESSTDIPGKLVNLRDLSGQPTEDGVLTKAGIVFRSDAPHHGDQVPDISHWPPRVVVDLRDADEMATQTHPMAEQATVRRVSVLEEVRKAQRQNGFVLSLYDLYQYMVTEVPRKLVKVFRLTLEADGPVLIHCAAGKDRTGVVSALLLAAAGVRRDSIIADYVHTDRNMFDVLRRLGEQPGLPPGVDEEAVGKLMSTPTDAIEGVLEHFDGYGGAVGWLVAHGVTLDEVQRWQRKFLVREELEVEKPDPLTCGSDLPE